MSDKKKLMIVESGGKIDKLKKILGDDWDVVACGGHIEGMTTKKGEMGFDEETLEIDYELSDRGEGFVRKTKANLKKFDAVCLASDPDREGEAIAKSLKKHLGLGEGDYFRCTFNSITKSQLANALSNPRKIDYSLVTAQEARRILDRKVGWDSTKALSQKLGRVSPVGRVQSQAVLFVVEREREINNFKPVKHFNVKLFSKTWPNEEDTKKDLPQWGCKLDKPKSGLISTEEIENDKGEKVVVETSYFTNKELADKIAKTIKKLTVIDIEESTKERSAPHPYRTSTIQQDAINKLGLTSKKTMEILQTLYEAGHITYMRTDSDAISDEGFDLLKEFAEQKGYPVLDAKRVRTRKDAVAQEGHECLRPTAFDYDGSDLEGDAKALYELIFNRTIASQLKPATYNQLKTTFEGECDGKTYIFNAIDSVLISKGWMVLKDVDEVDDDNNEKNPNGAEESEEKFPEFNIGDVVDVCGYDVSDAVTQPPKPFTEASLIKKMEKEGIGRPSTFATTVSTICDPAHGYIKTEKVGKSKVKALVSTSNAKDLVDTLTDVLSIMKTSYTRSMEQALDEIANGDKDYKEYLREVFALLEKENAQLSKAVRYPCPDCGAGMMQGYNKEYKKHYWICSERCGYKTIDLDGKPATREDIKKMKEDEIKRFVDADGKALHPCNICQSPMVRRENSNKKGKFYWRCSRDKDGCEGFAYDDGKTKTPIFDLDAFIKERIEKERVGFINEDGTPKFPCPDCGDVVVRRENSKEPGKFYWRCISSKQKCDFITFENREGKPVLDKEKFFADKEAEKQAKINAAMKDGKPLYPCPECKGPMEKRLTKTEPKRIWFGCFDRDCGTTTSSTKDGKPDYAYYKEVKANGGKKKTGTSKSKSKAKKPSSTKK